MRPNIWFVSGVAIILLALGGTAMADTLQVQCTAPTTCTAGGIQTTSSSSPTFNLATANSAPLGNLFLAIIVPNAGVGSTITVNGITSDTGVTFNSGSLWTALGESTGHGTLDHTFSSTQGFAGLVIPAPSQFTVYDVNLGTFTGSSESVDLNGFLFPAGTQFVGFVEGADGSISNWTPQSESLLVTPEPGSLFLFGTGFAGIAGFLRRKRSPNAS